jgi:hypothetical protein
VSLCRADVADAAVAVVDVVPVHEVGGPGSGGIQIGKARGRELWCIRPAKSPRRPASRPPASE